MPVSKLHKENNSVDSLSQVSVKQILSAWFGYLRRSGLSKECQSRDAGGPSKGWADRDACPGDFVCTIACGTQAPWAMAAAG